MWLQLQHDCGNDCCRFICHHYYDDDGGAGGAHGVDGYDSGDDYSDPGVDDYS